ncbi:MAG: haloacid dehalogenase type II [Chloroflexota bacterium]
MNLKDFNTLTFDCYGTLIDWESGMVNGLEPLVEQVQRKSGTELTRNTILEAHARHESAQQRQTPPMNYRNILAIVYKRLGEEWGVPASWDDCLRYGNSVKDWPAFPDSAEALAYLKAHYKLVIISNVDNQSFAASNEKLGVVFDAIYTAQDIGSYKPAAINFDYMLHNLQTLGVEKANILHTAESMFHDHAPANRHGLASCWIYRRYAQEGFGATMNPGDMPHYDFRFNSMAEMAEAHQNS